MCAFRFFAHREKVIYNVSTIACSTSTSVLIFLRPIVSRAGLFSLPVVIQRSPSRIVNQTSKETAVDARVKRIFNWIHYPSQLVIRSKGWNQTIDEVYYRPTSRVKSAIKITMVPLFPNHTKYTESNIKMPIIIPHHYRTCRVVDSKEFIKL